MVQTESEKKLKQAIQNKNYRAKNPNYQREYYLKNREYYLSWRSNNKEKAKASVLKRKYELIQLELVQIQI